LNTGMTTESSGSAGTARERRVFIGAGTVPHRVSAGEERAQR
jgi:hypothetical protein